MKLKRTVTKSVVVEKEVKEELSVKLCMYWDASEVALRVNGADLLSISGDTITIHCARHAQDLGFKKVEFTGYEYDTVSLED